MRYLLVIQASDRNRAGDFYMPLGLPYVNGAMRAKGLDVEAINLQYVKEDSLEALKKIILEKKIDVVLCGGLTTQYDSIKEIFDAAREVKKDIITIGGGGGFTSEPLLFSEMTNIDFAIMGESEISVCELADALDHGDDTTKIPGLVIKTDHGYIQTKERPHIIDLDTVSFPSYEGLCMEEYLEGQRVDGWYHTYAFYSDNPRIIPMLLARSCPFDSKFCFHPIGRGYRTRSLDNFFAELDIWVDKYHINGIALVDECFSIKPERVVEFCKRIKPYQLAWACQMRVETYSEELIKIMVDSGCVSATFGLESMSQKVLDDMNKKTKTEQLQKALEVAYDNGGGMCGNLIFGAEAEDLDSIRETMDWWSANNRFHMGGIIMIGAYPGSGYYRNAIARGIIQNKREFIEEKCPFKNLTKLDEKQYKILTAYTRFKNTEVVNKGQICSVKYHEQELLVDAVLKCHHCGYENQYKNIRRTSIETGKLARMACRKCHNYSDYVFDENRHKHKWNTGEWLYSLLIGRTENKLTEYCKDHNYANIAVYGIGGAIGEILIEELERANIKVQYAIDKNASAFQNKNINVLGLKDTFPKADVIFVTPVYYFNTIEKELSTLVHIPIVSLEEVLA